MVWEPLLKSSKSQLDLDWILDPANRGEYDTRGGWFGKAKMITNGPCWKQAWGLYQGIHGWSDFLSLSFLVQQ